jgi:hypothetical protein
VVRRDVRAEGAFVLDAVREAGETREVRVRSEAGGVLRLAHPFGARGVAIHSERGIERYADASGIPVLTLQTAAGEELRLVPR